jgi:hypothetical protein
MISYSTESLSLLEMSMALIFPLLCISITIGAVWINYFRIRESQLAIEDVKSHLSVAEVPGDTVEMYVELEADQRVREMEGRDARTV